MNSLRLTTFALDVTPPIGSPLCAGAIAPVAGVTDPLLALGVVLDWGEGRVVLCALDWCELRSEGHRTFQEALASAAGTDPDRVAVQCVHQHNAPIVDPAAQRWIATQDDLPALMDEAWFAASVQQAADAARAAIPRLERVTRVTAGRAEVREVASNRRVPAGDGTVRTRWSACADASLRAEPERLIDPDLTSITFRGKGRKLAVLHYYATHPMSFYGDGQVTSDFMGWARRRRVEEDEGVPHLVFTGCAGDVTAGKYNDGSPENRAVLADRVHAAMVASERAAREIVPFDAAWRTCAAELRPRAHPGDEALPARLADRSRPRPERAWAAMEISYRAWAAEHPDSLSCLTLGEGVSVLHLPGEPFVEYQRYARSLRPEGIVAVAGYGDGGVGYIPLERSFPEGGYEPEWAFAEPESEWRLKRAIDSLLL